ncbi:AraC family transcriptional regulator [Niastella vici]|uniref:AraC family transcriptional regulator n=1 Tax=Niastella vici TaxID=1703345 RepID=A0A1V9FMU1_9BACT|nr:AraC family transcriptional regulator [Niastella vici]OQP59576.1 AraC family transcriptional regulator [Niastella vici]
MEKPVVLDKGCYVGAKVSQYNFGGIITSETCFPENYTSNWHYHQNPHFSHILTGGSKEQRPRNAQTQLPGDGLYYYPGIPHKNVEYRPGTRIFNIEIDAAFFKAHDLQMPDADRMFADSTPINSSGLLKILKQHYFHDAHSQLAIEQLCTELVSAYPVVAPYSPAWSRNIITVMHDHWDQPLSLAQLSAKVNIHPVTLSKYFSRYFHCSLGDYARKIKVEKAVQLMRSRQLSLTAIAYQCGFSDQAHFTKTFYLFTGLLPKQYRKL